MSASIHFTNETFMVGQLCYFTLSLSLSVVGSTPVISLNEAGGGQVNVSCNSHGWLPEPSIIWTDKDGRDLKPLSKDMFTTSKIYSHTNTIK